MKKSSNNLSFMPARLAYLANIFILTPVLISMFFQNGDNGLFVFQGLVKNEDGLRLLVASLWFAILIFSIVGLIKPKFSLSILVFQVIYKTTYLLVFILPIILNKGWVAVPMGLTISFLLIVIIWPFIIWKSLLEK